MMESPTPIPPNLKASPLFWSSPNTTIGDTSTSFFDDDTRPLNRVLFCATPQPWDCSALPEVVYEGDSISEVFPWPPTPSSIQPRHSRAKYHSEPDISLDTSIDFQLSSTPPRGEPSEQWISRSPSSNPFYTASSIQSTPSRYSSAGRILTDLAISSTPSQYSPTSPRELVHEETYETNFTPYFHLHRISEETIETPVHRHNTFPNNLLLDLPPTPPKYKVQPPQGGTFPRGIPIFVGTIQGGATAQDVLQAVLDGNRSSKRTGPPPPPPMGRINSSSDPHHSVGPKRGRRKATRGGRRKTSPGLVDMILGRS